MTSRMECVRCGSARSTQKFVWSCMLEGSVLSPLLFTLYIDLIALIEVYQSINQSINLYRAIVQRRVLQCGYAESKRNVLRRILNVLTDGAVRQFSGREFQSLGAATEKQRAAVSKLCGRTDRNFCVDDRSKRDWLYGLIRSAPPVTHRGNSFSVCIACCMSVYFIEFVNSKEWLHYITLELLRAAQVQDC